MIETMKYINIMGPVDDLDRVAEKYLSKYDIQLEYTLKELSNEKGLVPFTDPNPYSAILKKAEKLVKMTGLEPECVLEGNNGAITEMTKDDAVNTIEYASGYFEKISKDISDIKAQRDALKETADAIKPFEGLDFKFEDIARFDFIKCRFGKMPVTGFKQFEAFIYKDSEILFVESKRDSKYIWFVYFVPAGSADKVDSIFSSLHFERTEIPLEIDGEPLNGKPDYVLGLLIQKQEALDNFIKQSEQMLMEEADSDKTNKINKKDIMSAYEKIKILNRNCDVRRYAAKTLNGFYIFVGWMTKRDALVLEKEISGDGQAVLIIEDDNDAIVSEPPTKLKNPFIVKPFEFFVKMYGLPHYSEIDPTPFVALTYTVLFGIMFGDVGQGFALSLIGFLLYRKKGLALGRIMGIIGVSSMFFGLLFGSFFGFEFHGLWMHPAEPENINSILLYAVGFGVFLIITSMTFNMANALRQRKLNEILFDPNGVAGSIFYIALLMIAVSMLTGNGNAPGWIIPVFIVLPIVLIAFREPLKNIISRKNKIIHGSIPLFLFEMVIELFEVVLNYFTNTLSFVRVGAFALSHACMMSVVMLLSETASGSNDIIVVILGNLLVMALEGLIVGIQVLRLEFYEMFSRFYKGSGREFEPYKKY